jgi:hypothetical protein
MREVRKRTPKPVTAARLRRRWAVSPTLLLLFLDSLISSCLRIPESRYAR